MGLHHSREDEQLSDARLTVLIQQATYRDMMLPRLRGDFLVRFNRLEPMETPISSLEELDQLSILGEGAFGVVHLVRQKRTGDQYALKVLSKSQVVKMKQVEHVLSEKLLQQSISFPFCVKALSSFKDPLNLYVVMEYLSGGELFDCLRALGKLSEEHARFYGTQVILAFEYMHYLDLVYRDLKPENIMIAQNGYIKITDFGFVKYLGKFARTWTLCGTPEYMAPEVILNQGTGKAADWWSFGVLLYEMVAGVTPFYHELPVRMYEKISHGKFDMPKEFSPELQDIIKNLLQVDRTKRYGAMYDGAGDIKMHDFFVESDWSGIYYHKYASPFTVPPAKPATPLPPRRTSSRTKVGSAVSYDKNAYISEFNDF